MNQPEVPLRVADLLLAAELTGGDRNDQYGPPIDQYETVARLFSVLTGKHINAREAAMMMVCVKLARLKNDPCQVDSYVDAMAYLGIAHECAEHLRARQEE